MLSGLLLLPLTAVAQDAGTIRGTVVNADSRNPAAEVVVTATSPALTEEKFSVTDKAGKFTLADLPPGTYTVRFESARYRPFSRSGIEVRPGGGVTFNAELIPEAGLVSEEVVVTGTRIPRIEVGTAAPVTVVSRADITTSGRASIGEILQRLPEQNGGLNTQFNNGGDGSVRIDLRGLGTARTLVLLNGRRVVAGGTGANSSVDLNTIPTQAIQRIEVLKDGASAVYGSDAISGVVNIITRSDFSGTEVGGFLGTSQRFDGTLYDANFLTGHSTDRAHILFSAGLTGQQQVWAGDRDFSFYDRGAGAYDFNAKQIYTLGSSAVPQGRFTSRVAADQGNAAWADLKARYPTASTFILDPDPAVGWRPFRAGGVDPAGDSYNYQPANYLVTPMTRVNLFSTGSIKLAEPVNAFFEAAYTNRQSEQKLAAEPLFTVTEGLTVTPDNAYNPFGIPLTDVRRRLVEFGGNRIFNQDLDTFRVVTGLNGGWTMGESNRWNWDAFVNYGRTQGVETKRGLLHLSRLAAALGPSYQDPTTGEWKCGTEAAPIDPDNCVPLNLFGGPGTITDEMEKYVSYTGTARGYNQQLIFEANLNGELFKLGNARNPIAVAVGLQHRREAAAQIPDPLTNKGDTTGNKQAETQGSYFSNEGYLELSLPLLGRFGSDAPGDLLELQLAGRLVRFTSFGNNFTYKAGVRISPIPDATLRGTYSTAFRAPGIGELYLGQTDTFPSATDPCSVANDGDLREEGTPLDVSCDAQGVPNNHYDDRSQFNTPFGGSTSLRPETANIFTVGVVIQPRWVPNLSLTADYYNIDVRDAINILGADVILDSCHPDEAGVTPQYCDRIHRNDQSLITQIDDPLTNVGGNRVSGVDLAADYEPNTPIGRVGLGAALTWLQKYDQEIAGGAIIAGKGNYDLNLILPEWRGNFNLRWGLEALSAQAAVRWIGVLKECDGGVCSTQEPDAPTPLSRTIEPWAALDLSVGYRLPRASGLNTTILAGVNNVLDTEPAFVNNGFLAGSDAATYDYMGRYFYVRLNHSFQ